MSDVDLLEHLSLRELPAVERIEPPERYSQTLLKHFENCHRAAYLYVKHHGGMPAHALDRGSAFHVFAARATIVMLSQNERRIPPELARTLLHEVLAEHPEWTIPLNELDDLREMAYHFSQGVEIDPDLVAAVERKFVLPLGDHVLSGIVDLAHIDGDTAVITDYKTQFMPLPTSEYEASFQGRFYSALLLFGQPVNDDGTLDPCLGSRITWVDVGESYPRHLGDDGRMRRAHMGMSRLQVQEIRDDLERMAGHLAHAFETGEWPAVHGSHCSICPCEPACPLPRELRSYAGAINTLEEAQEASVWLERWSPRLEATRKELRLWAKQNGPFRFGRDREWTFETRTSRIVDWEGLKTALEESRQYGVPFDMAAHRKVRESTTFRAMTVGVDNGTEEEQP